MYSKHILSVVADSVRSSCVDSRNAIQAILDNKRIKDSDQQISDEVKKFQTRILDMSIKNMTKEHAIACLKQKLTQLGEKNPSNTDTEAVSASGQNNLTVDGLKL